MPPTPDGIQGSDFIVEKSNWRNTRLVPSPIDGRLDPSEVLFRVDRFALTSNNISYAMAGDTLGYWKFFPAEEGWGRIPAMGFGEVIRSEHPDVIEGERYFGFFPMSHHLVVQASSVNPTSFSDAAPQRSDTAPVYRQYMNSKHDAMYREDREDQMLLLRGLFMTSFLVDDFIEDNDFFGAQDFVISSASSKTAIALATLLAQRSRGRVIGLTSPRNRDFVESLSGYDEVVVYAEIKSLASDVPVVFIDHSGDGEVVDTLHHHLGDNLKYSCMVGGTHWDSSNRSNDLPGARPTFFFAPAQIQKRAQEWGPAGFQERLGDAWHRFDASSDAWLEVQRGAGAADLERVYQDILDGRAQPHHGHVLSLWDA